MIKTGSINKCTHLDLSGIEALTKSNIPNILGELAEFENCGNLLGLHLNDLGINNNQELSDEIKDIFHISEKNQLKMLKGDLHAAFRIYIDKIKGGLKYRKEKADKFNYVTVLNRALGKEITKNTEDDNKQHNIILA